MRIVNFTCTLDKFIAQYKKFLEKLDSRGVVNKVPAAAAIPGLTS